MDPNRPRSELRAYPHPPTHHVATPLDYVYINHNGDAEGGIQVPIMEHPYHLNMSGATPDYSNSIPRGSHGMLFQQQLPHHQPPPNVQPPPRSIPVDHQPRLHYHPQYDNIQQPPPLQVEQLNDEQAHMSTAEFIIQSNTESMINESVNEAFLTTTGSPMSINDPNAHAHLQHHQQPVHYNTSSERNIYNFAFSANHGVTSIPSTAAPEGVLDLSKADDMTLTQQFKEEIPPSPLPHHEPQYQQSGQSLPVPFDQSQGQPASVIVHTANISPGSRASIPEPNSEDCGAFRILTTSSASPAKERRFRAFPPNRPRPRIPYLHAYHFGNHNLQQPVELHYQYNSIMSEIPTEQKPMLATNHLPEPVLNYNPSPVTSSPQQMWNGGYPTPNQLTSPPKSHPRLHSNASQSSLSAIVEINNQLSQRHFSENSVVSEHLIHRLTDPNAPSENYYNTATPTNFSPGTQSQMMHENTSYVNPSTSTPGPSPSPKKIKIPRNSGDKMGRGRGINKLANKTYLSPDVTAPFQNVQNHYNHQLNSPYPEVEGMTPKKGRGRGRKVIANALNISCAESDFEAVPVEVNNVDRNKSQNVFTPEGLQSQLENGEVVVKQKRSYKKRAPKSLNVSVNGDASPPKPVKKTTVPKVNRKNKSAQVELEPAQSQQEPLPNFDTISRGILNIEDTLSSPSQVISMGSTDRGKGRGRGVRRSTSEGRGRGVRRSLGEGRGRRGRGSTGEGRGRGCLSTQSVSDEMMGSHMVAVVIPAERQVPWVGPTPGSSEFPINGIVPNNHMGLHHQSKGLQQLPKKYRVIVDGKPLDVSEKSISKTLSVPNPSVIASNQIISASVQVQMAETGEMPVSSAGRGRVPRSRVSLDKGQRKSFKPKPKVCMDLYQGSDDEIDSNADDDDDEDYEDLEKRRRITRRKSRLTTTQPEPEHVYTIANLDTAETDYFDPASLQENGLPNEMLVSAQDIKKEKGEEDEPMEEEQLEEETVGETENALPQLQDNAHSEDAEGIQDVKQENAEDAAVEDTGISEMQVDPEGTFGDAEGGLVTETLVDVKPVVAKRKVKNRRLLPSVQRQLKRPIKKPRIPMRESLGVNFTSRRVEKRVRRKKSVDHDNIVVKTEKFESRPKELAEKTEIKLVVPKYPDEEKELLYDDKRFIIDISSVDKSPDQIYIWQIIKSENCLRQYYPSKYGEKQFFISSPVKWYFFEEEFKSDEFYARFLPIVVVIANTIEQKIVRQGEVSPSQECTVQYVYVDRPFFAKTLKCIGKIDTVEFLRPHFIHVLTLLTLITIKPTLLDPDLRNRPYVKIKNFAEIVASWNFFGAFISDLLRKVLQKIPFQEEILKNLMDYPSLILSIKDVNKTEPCSGCHRVGSVPCVAVKFPTRGNMEKPYDRETLIELAPENFPQPPPKPMSICRGCSNAAKRLHRLIHYRYHTIKLLKQNIPKDVATFHKYKTQITDEILLWIQTMDVCWKNVIFLEFQIIVAEIQQEFSARPMLAVDAPTPIANPDLEAVVPNEM